MNEIDRGAYLVTLVTLTVIAAAVGFVVGCWVDRLWHLGGLS